MSTTAFILLLVVSSSMLIDSRSLSGPEQFIPLLLSSTANNGNPPNSPPSSGPNRLVEVVEHIIRYVSTITSSEDFIDNLINRQNQLADKLKILRFLKNCFRITGTIIEQEIIRARHASIIHKKSFLSSTYTLEELNEARNKIVNLLDVIDEKTATLKAWVPPTMPFLSF